MNTPRMYTLEDAKIFGHYRQKEPYEYVFGAMIWALRHGDDEVAGLLSAHLDCVDGGNDCDLCGREHREYVEFVQRQEELEAVR